MDKVLLSNDDARICEEYVKKHLSEYKEFCAKSEFPFTDVEIAYKDIGMSFKIYKKASYTNLYITVDNKRHGYIRFMNSTMEVIKDKLDMKQKEEYYDAYITGYYAIMFYIATYRPVLEPKEIKPLTKTHKRSNKKSTNITYLFNRHFIKNPSKVGTKHRPCEYAYKVRGHYRHLKNGKKVWVREYIKGKGKPKERLYKI